MAKVVQKTSSSLCIVLIAGTLALLLTATDRVAGQSDLQTQRPSPTTTTRTPQGKKFGELRGTVSIIVLDGGFQIVGSPDDIKTIERAIASISRQLETKTAPPVSERVVLNFQLADTIEPLLANAMEFSGEGMNLQISALHFPESLLLVGPAQEVERAKEYLKTIDSHKAFSQSMLKKLKPNQRH